MVGAGAGIKPVTVAPSVTHALREQEDGGVVPVVLGLPLGDDVSTLALPVLAHVFAQAIYVGTAVAALSGVPRDFCLIVTVTVLVGGPVLVETILGYGPAGVVTAAASLVPAVPSSMFAATTLLKFMAFP